MVSKQRTDYAFSFPYIAGPRERMERNAANRTPPKLTNVNAYNAAMLRKGGIYDCNQVQSKSFQHDGHSSHLMPNTMCLFYGLPSCG